MKEKQEDLEKKQNKKIGDRGSVFNISLSYNVTDTLSQKTKTRGWQMAQRLRALSALEEGPGSVVSTHMVLSKHP